MKIMVVGGGYAGLSCLMALADLLPDSRRILVDPSDYHLKQTRLQEALRRSLDGLRIPFDALGRKYGFLHLKGKPSMSARARARTVSGVQVMTPMLPSAAARRG